MEARLSYNGKTWSLTIEGASEEERKMLAICKGLRKCVYEGEGYGRTARWIDPTLSVFYDDYNEPRSIRVCFEAAKEVGER